MADAILSRSQRNDIFQLIQRIGLDPMDFSWKVVNPKSDPVETITHAPTNAKFSFSHWQGDGWWLDWKPMTPEGDNHDSVGMWPMAVSKVQRWLQLVHQDHTAPDLWGAVGNERVISDAAQDEHYAQPFTAPELKLLEAGLADIESYVTNTQPLDPDAGKRVRGHFRYLLESAKSGVRKVDWLNVFVGQIVSMVTEGLIDAKFYRPLMAHATTALHAVFQFGVKLLNQG
jgi:hypothetical protein